MNEFNLLMMALITAALVICCVVYVNNSQWNTALDLCINGGGKPVECMRTLQGRRDL